MLSSPKHTARQVFFLLFGQIMQCLHCLQNVILWEWCKSEMELHRVYLHWRKYGQKGWDRCCVEIILWNTWWTYMKNMFFCDGMCVCTVIRNASCCGRSVCVCVWCAIAFTAESCSSCWYNCQEECFVIIKFQLLVYLSVMGFFTTYTWYWISITCLHAYFKI